MKHPCTTLCATDISRLQDEYKSGTYKRWFKKLFAETPVEHQPRPCKRVCVMWDKSCKDGENICLEDGPMAYRFALMYVITNDSKFAEKSLDIITAWVRTCKECTGDNQQLSASWSQTNFARAMELLMTYPRTGGVKIAYLEWYTRVMEKCVMKRIEWSFKNGDAFTNWHCAVLECRMQIAILRDAQSAFTECVELYKSILDVIIEKPWNLPNETVYRDFMHGCMSIGSMVNICETAYHQGVDLYKLRDNLLCKVVEASAAIVLGEVPRDLPQALQKVQYWPYGWYTARNHFVCRKNLVMKYTTMLIKKFPVDYSWLFHCCTALTHITDKHNFM